MNKNDSDVAELGAEVKGHDVSFLLLVVSPVRF
jgi:hypothetical protein